MSAFVIKNVCGVYYVRGEGRSWGPYGSRHDARDAVMALLAGDEPEVMTLDDVTASALSVDDWEGVSCE